MDHQCNGMYGLVPLLPLTPLPSDILRVGGWVFNTFIALIVYRFPMPPPTERARGCASHHIGAVSIGMRDHSTQYTVYRSHARMVLRVVFVSLVSFAGIHCSQIPNTKYWSMNLRFCLYISISVPIAPADLIHLKLRPNISTAMSLQPTTCHGIVSFGVGSNEAQCAPVEYWDVSRVS